MCGGGGSSGPTETTVVNQQIPEEMIPFAMELAQRGMTELDRPYDPYTGQRLAWFSPTEQEGMNRLAAFGMSGDNPNLVQAGQYATAGGNYNPMGRASAYRAGSLGPVQYSPGSYGSGYGAGSIRSNYRPTDYNMSYGGPGQYQMGYNPNQYTTGYGAGNYETGYQATDYASDYKADQMSPDYVANQYGQGEGDGYTAGQRDVGFDPGQLNDWEQLQSYMNPYHQAVTDIRRRKAIEESERNKAQLGATAAGSGSLGGYREAIERSQEDWRNDQLLDEIQATGSKEAYDSAVQNMVRDREGRAQLEQFQQGQFNLNEAAKQMQTKYGLDSFQANEAARQMQQQFGMQAFQMNEQARQMEEQLKLAGYSESEAAKQVQEQFGQSGWSMVEQARQMEEQYKQQTFQMNESVMQAKEQFAQSAFGENERAKQMFEQLQQSGYSIEESAKQTAQQFKLDAFQLSEQAKQAEENFKQNAFQMNEQGKQMYEQLRQAGYSMEQAAQQAQEQLLQSQFGLNMQDRQFASSQQLAASGLLSGLAGQQQQMELERLNTLMGVGGMERALIQSGLDMGYQDYLSQRNYGWDQLGRAANIVYGNPMMQGGTQTTQRYGYQAPFWNQFMGAAIPMAASYGGGWAEGGQIGGLPGISLSGGDE